MAVEKNGTMIGRPKKGDLEGTKTLSKREQAAALKEFRQRLLLNPKSPALVEKLFDLAFDDEAKNQAVALKILSDRLMPVAGFTADGKQQASVSINITGIGSESKDVSAGVTIDGNSGEPEPDSAYTQEFDQEPTDA